MIDPKRTGSLIALILVTAASAQAGAVYDAVNDYLPGWTAGNNPNGTWQYGWSTTPGTSFTLYTNHGNDLAPTYPNLADWFDPSNFIFFTPIVYLNNGPAITDGALDNLPAGALVIHGGGTDAACGSAGSCFSEVVWTAPSTGFINLSATFTGRQFGMNGMVEIVQVTGGGPAGLFAGSLFDGSSQSFNQGISVQAGDSLIFAARSNVGLAADTSQLQATITFADAPEPSTFVLLVAGLGWIGRGTMRRRSR